ncbi:immunity 49 family protein [Streptomyces sp. NPDC051020]|uniref:immunity 49 family protein n=1 Tax=Streptomyces sp. NPDC051020 TaxID=3155409 RepID=UPI003446B142
MSNGDRRNPRFEEDMRFKRIAGPLRYNRVAQGPVQYVRVAADNGVVIGYVWANDEGEAAGWVVPPGLGAAEINAGAAWIRKLRDAKARDIVPTALLAELIRDTSDIQGSRVVPGSPAECTTLDELKELADKGGQVVTHVPRHDFRTDNAAEVMAPVIKAGEEVLDDLESSEFDRFDALGYTLATAKWRCLTDPMATEFPTWEAWVTAMQVGSALFISGAAAEGPVPCRIGSRGEVKNLPATGPQEYLHAGDWLTSFYLATICRENERLNKLAQVPVSFLRESGAEFDEYIYAWVETLQNAWFGRRETWDTLVTAVNGTAPERAQAAGKELMLKILYPPLELFHRYRRQDAEKFNAALVEALTWHKEYWTANEARSLSGEGLVALAPLAIACMAHDAGIPIEVESEYLPKALLQRNWAGEYDT